MIVFWSPQLRWTCIFGIAVGVVIGVQIGGWMTYLTLRNPLAWLIAEYRRIWRESGRLWRECEAKAAALGLDSAKPGRISRDR